MKKYIIKSIILFILICFPMTFCGCWDYTEMHDIKFSAGIAIDKDKFTNEYIVTIELLKAAADGKSIKSDIVQSRGKTIHAALRDAIKTTGKQLQVSHMKIVIISKDIAEEGILPIVDLMNRDMEVRNDMWILISQMNTASEIFTKGKGEEAILSHKLADTVINYNKIGKYVATEIFKLIDDISSKGISATVPMINIATINEKPTVQISKVAVFNGNNMVGELNENEAMTLQLLKEKKLKFVMPITLQNNVNISLELMNIRRKVKVKTKEDSISMDIYLDIDVGLSELSETEINFVSKPQRDKFKKQSEDHIKRNSNELIKKLQKQYKSDAIGLGQILSKKKPKEWKKVENNWIKSFENMEVNVFPNVNIKYSGGSNKNIEVGD